MAKKKIINERCPFHDECERTKCEHIHSESGCEYYYANARPGAEIADQNNIPYPDILDEADEPMTSELVYLPIDSLFPHPDNPRKDLGDLTELADSIKANGIMQNLTVIPGHVMTKEEFINMTKKEGISKSDAALSYSREMAEVSDGYTIVIGHRRHAAAEIAGLTMLPCIITEMSYEDQIATMAIENMQRSDLTLYEQTNAIQMMLDLGASIEHISRKTGFSQTTVRRRVKLSTLDKSKFQEAEVRGGTIDDYLKVAEIKDPKERDKATDAIGTNNFDYTVRVALRKQEFKEKEPVIKAVMDRLGIKHDDSIKTWDNKYENVVTMSVEKFSESCLDDIIKDGILYWWKIEYETTLYVFKKAEKKKKEPVQKSPKEVEAIERRNQLKTISETAFQLRKAFVESFTAETKYADTLNEWAFELIKRKLAGEYSSYNIKWLCEVIGEEYTTYKYYCDRDLIEKFILSSPASKVIILSIISGDKEDLRYYKDNGGEMFPSHTSNETLDFIYKYLCELGYRMSDEEKALQDGTHELFKHEESEESE